jgi:hypothetical protein
VVSKANLRNMQIVESHVKTPLVRTKPDRLFIGLLIVGLIIFALAVGFITVAIWNFVLNLL